MSDRTADLAEIGRLVPDGATVALGGSWLSNHPMAAVRELIRARRRALHVLTVVGSVDIDLLIAADAVSHLTFSMVSLEAFGLAPRFRRAVEAGELHYTELSGLAILIGLEARGRGVPFLPYRGPAGSDLLAQSPDAYRDVTCPFTGEELTGVRAIEPDVAIVHALRSDAEGNAQWDGTSGPDVEMARAARTVIVTCERIVPRSTIEANAHMTKLPGFYVDAVIESPFGAHPTSHVPEYVLDAWQLLDYVDSAADEAAASSYLEQLRGEDETTYRERVLAGGRDAVLRRLISRTQLLRTEDA